MADKQKEQGEAPGRLSRLSRVTSFWALIVLLSLAALSVRRGSQQPVAELSYSEFRRQVEAENISEVTLTRDRGVMEGEFRSPVIKDGIENTTFKTTLTGDLSEELENRLYAQGANIESENDSDAWWTLLIGILPWVLIIGIWFWFFRAMQSGGNKAFQFGRSKAKMISPDTP